MTIDKALAHGATLAEEGADIIDVGGESTRPGAAGVSLQEEMDRVLPVIEALAGEIGVPLSVDTTKSSLAREALRVGTEFINDISGLNFDPQMAGVAAEGGAGLFLMHTSGRPDSMQRNTEYEDLIGDILEYLGQSIRRAVNAGVDKEKIAVDPGIGFGKTAIGNLEILRRIAELQVLGRPILLGTSRKKFIGKILDQPDAEKRLAGTLSTVALGVAMGAHIFRVHDVRPAREAALVAWAIQNGEIPLRT